MGIFTTILKRNTKGSAKRLKSFAQNMDCLNNLRGAHMYGGGCQKCAAKRNKSESAVADFITENTNLLVIRNDRTLLLDRTTKHYKELDFYFPTLKKAIEFNGEHWHEYHERRWREVHPNETMTYHEFKENTCKELGIELLNINYEDWLSDRSGVEKRILKFLETPSSIK